MRDVEMRLYGRTHLQTVSLFGPVLYEHPTVADVIFRHPQLNFATTHFYDAKTINHPKDTVNPAICTGALVREALEHLHQPKPFFDSEHGPIHNFKDLKKTLPDDFDDEYFRHIQWAHLASGAAGGGMRWPNRHPHVLTSGMRQAQASLANFVKLIDWSNFKRKNLNQELKISSNAFAGFCCADEEQAIVYLLRQDKRDKKKLVDKAAPAVAITLSIPGLQEGNYQVYFWKTLEGELLAQKVLEDNLDNQLRIEVPPIITEVAIAIKKIV